MSEWDAIKFMFGKRFKTDMIAFCITMLATITLDLTQAILIGTIAAATVFLNKIVGIDITVQEVDIELHEKLQKQGGTLMFTGVHENARAMMETIGAENFFWSSDQAIVEAEARGCKFC